MELINTFVTFFSPVYLISITFSLYFFFLPVEAFQAERKKKPFARNQQGLTACNHDVTIWLVPFHGKGHIFISIFDISIF